jgi:large subunit ribosomal protein L24
MSIAKIQKGDKIRVIAGKYKGTDGVVTKIVKTTKTTRVSVDTINKIVKYQKSNKAAGMPGQMLQTDRFIDVSNVALVDDKNKITKSFIDVENTKKVRKFRSNSKVVLKAKVEKKVVEDTKELTTK